MTLLNRAVAAFAVAIALGGADPSRAADIVQRDEVGILVGPYNQLDEDREANLVEAGVRWQLTPLTVLSAGAGAGFLDESPQFRFLVGSSIR